MRAIWSCLVVVSMAAAAACSGGDGEQPSGGGSGGSGGSGSSGGAGAGATGGSGTTATSGTGGSGGAGATGGGGGAEATGCEAMGAEPILFGADVQPLLNKSCGGNNTCHFKAMPSGGLPLAEGQSHAALVNKKSIASGCKERTLVVPGNAAQSYLVDKLRNGGPALCGKTMPYDDPMLPDSEIQVVEEWICQGAKDD